MTIAPALSSLDFSSLIPVNRPPGNPLAPAGPRDQVQFSPEIQGPAGGLSGGFFGALGENFGTPKNAGGGGGLVQEGFSSQSFAQLSPQVKAELESRCYKLQHLCAKVLTSLDKPLPGELDPKSLNAAERKADKGPKDRDGKGSAGLASRLLQRAAQTREEFSKYGGRLPAKVEHVVAVALTALSEARTSGQIPFQLTT